MRYTPFARLMRGTLDGLIVTGCEPHAETLPKEAFWRELTEVIDWAEHNTRSTIWSCLAAHAAVLHLDGVERQRLPAKRSGLFRVATVGQHPLLDGAPSDLRVPHSRWNGLDATKLTAAGYNVLTQGDVVGIDTFVKSWRSLFIYLQGHPEYDAGALGREYRRGHPSLLRGEFSQLSAIARGIFRSVDRSRSRRIRQEGTRPARSSPRRRAPDPQSYAGRLAARLGPHSLSKLAPLYRPLDIEPPSVAHGRLTKFHPHSGGHHDDNS